MIGFQDGERAGPVPLPPSPVDHVDDAGAAHSGPLADPGALLHAEFNRGQWKCESRDCFVKLRDEDLRALE
jgi:hypothetical protein